MYWAIVFRWHFHNTICRKACSRQPWSFRTRGLTQNQTSSRSIPGAADWLGKIPCSAICWNLVEVHFCKLQKPPTCPFSVRPYLEDHTKIQGVKILLNGEWPSSLKRSPPRQMSPQLKKNSTADQIILALHVHTPYQHVISRFLVDSQQILHIVA